MFRQPTKISNELLRKERMKICIWELLGSIQFDSLGKCYFNCILFAFNYVV